MNDIKNLSVELSATRKVKHWLFMGFLVLSTFATLIPLFWILAFVFKRGYPALNLAFFTELPKPVGEVGGGLAHAFVGSLKLIIVASVISVPWGVGLGIYLSEYGKGKFAESVRFATQLLASVPSIVIGLFAYAIFVYPFHHFSALAGSMALAIIMIPTVAKTSEELLKMVPTHIREAGLGLGLPRWRVTLQIVLRGCRSGIITGVMLAIARAAGETAPLLFTALSSQNFSSSLTEPTASVPVLIYTYAITPYEDWHQKAFAASLVLVVFILATNLITRLILREKK